MKLRRLSHIIITASLAVTLHPASAQNAHPVAKTKASPSREVELPEIVVSATRFEEESWKSGSSISTVPGSTVHLQRPIQLGQVLWGEPGVTINSGSSGLGGVSQISIRGLPFSRTLIEVDGLRFNRPIDGAANMADLPPLLTGNIEILRGPQSSLYGSEAQGGVVSINTPRGSGKPSVGASFEAGTFNSRRERVFSKGEFKRFDWNIEYSRFDTDNARPNNNFRQDAAALRFGFDISDVARVDLTARYTDNTVGSPAGIDAAMFGANDPDDRLMRRMTMISPSFTFVPVEEWETKLTLGYIGVGQRFDAPISAAELFPGQFVDHSESLQLNWQNILRLAEWNTLILGVEARNEHTTTEADSGNNVFNRATQSAYWSDSVRWVDWWGITLSARYDDNEGFRDAWTYRASQVFTAPVIKTRPHMSFGTAFRAPTVSELQPLFGPGSGNNPSLAPETTEGFDIGVTQPFLDGKLELDSTCFYNNVVNQIGFSGVFPNSRFNNASETRTEGVENSIKWRAIKSLLLRGTFTLTSTTSKDGRFSGNDLQRIPRETASLSSTWSVRNDLDLSLVWNYSGVAFDDQPNAQKLSAFHRLDLFANYKLKPWLTLFGRAENLLGYRYQQAAGLPALGRAFYGGLELTY